MKWSLIKKWAKEKGYSCVREKTTNSANPNEYDYYWTSDNDVAVSGIAFSVSSLATDVYNHITNNKHLEYQQKAKQELANIIQDSILYNLDKGLF
tara:strand:- start:462 stop:746 length:285 start_codon:yes stop_codon:yes gene_type:complete